MDSFSKEYIFRQCELHRHCIALHLKDSISFQGQILNTIYITGVITSEEEGTILLQNIHTNVNTYGELTVRAFMDGRSPQDFSEITVNTANIESTEQITE